MASDSSHTGKILALFAIVLQIAITMYLVLEVYLAGLFIPAPYTATFAELTIIIVVVIGFFGFLWTVLDYFMIYRRIKEGKVRRAREASLILGILQLLFGGVFPGILLLITYTQL